MGSFLAKGGRVSGKTVDQRCPDFKCLDPSLLPGASVSSSVKTDGFCPGAAGNGLKLADDGNLDYENLVFDGTGYQR